MLTLNQSAKKLFKNTLYLCFSSLVALRFVDCGFQNSPASISALFSLGEFRVEKLSRLRTPPLQKGWCEKVLFWEAETFPIWKLWSRYCLVSLPHYHFSVKKELFRENQSVERFSPPWLFFHQGSIWEHENFFRFPRQTIFKDKTTYSISDQHLINRLVKFQREGEKNNDLHKKKTGPSF